MVRLTLSSGLLLLLLPTLLKLLASLSLLEFKLSLGFLVLLLTLPVVLVLVFSSAISLIISRIAKLLLFLEELSCVIVEIMLMVLLKNPRTLLVHELEPKKWVFGSGGCTKHNIDF